MRNGLESIGFNAHPFLLLIEFSLLRVTRSKKWNIKNVDDVGEEAALWPPDVGKTSEANTKAANLGLIMSRAFGDSAAKKLGLSVEPVFKTIELSGLETYIVMATRGVHGITGLQDLEKLARKHPDAQQLATNIVARAYDEWECQFRTEDVCCMVIHVGKIFQERIREKEEKIERERERELAAIQEAAGK